MTEAKPPTKADWALWKRSFVDWSQSPWGFYVDQYYDPRQDWVKRVAPVVWDERQARFLRHALTVGRNGRLPYSELWIIDIGKSAKTLIQAATAQWLGMFGDQDAEILLNANSEKQSEVRCFEAITNSLASHPYSRDIAEVLTREIRFTKTGNVIRPIPMKAETQAGSNAILIGFDEIHGYEGEAARAHVAEQKESPTRKISLTIVTSYPPFIDSDGPMNDFLNHYFDEFDRPRDNLAQVDGLEDLPFWVDRRAGIAIWWNHDPYPWHLHRNEAGVTYLERQRLKPMMTHTHYLRIWEARRTGRSDTFMPMEQWDRCEDDEHKPLQDWDRKVPMVIAVDIGIKHDSSALVARAWNPVNQRMELLYHKIWRPEQYAGRDVRDVIGDVKNLIYYFHKTQNVLACYYDPSQFQWAAAELSKLGVRMKEFTQNTMRVAADTNYRALIASRALRNYPQAADLRQHVSSAIGVVRADGTIRMDKRKTSMLIDAAVADSMCCYGVHDHKERFTRLARRGNRTEEPRQLQHRDAFRKVFYG